MKNRRLLLCKKEKAVFLQSKKPAALEKIHFVQPSSSDNVLVLMKH